SRAPRTSRRDAGSRAGGRSPSAPSAPERDPSGRTRKGRWSRSREEPQTLRIVERLRCDDRGSRLAEDVDGGHGGRLGVLDRQGRERDAALDEVAVAAGRHIADRFPGSPHRLVAVGVGVAGLDREAGERAADSSLALTQQGVTADEVALVEADEALEPGL